MRIPLTMVSEEEQKASLTTEREKEVNRFISRVAKRVLRMLRESPGQYPKDQSTMFVIGGLLRQHGVPARDRQVIAELIYKEYCDAEVAQQP